MKKFMSRKDAAIALQKAMASGDETAIQQAWEAFAEAVAGEIENDYQDAMRQHDENVLEQRGYRTLTSAEQKWYERVIDAMRTGNPKQSFTDIINSGNKEDLMPETIIEDVYKDLVDEYPLLSAINMQYVGYITKWILNDHTRQSAVWGTITDEITKEITSAFKVVSIEQNKLSAYAVIEQGMLDLGPRFLDNYIRTVLKEALSYALETAIISGTGHNEPIGLIRNIGDDVEINASTGYPAKEVIKVTSLSPSEYGALVAKLAKNDAGKVKKIKKVALIVNPVDYLTKIMPATTVQATDGTYKNNIFPIPTEVYQSVAVEEGKAILALLEEYYLFAGGKKNGVIEYSDDVKFLEDQRVFKIKQYATGKATDNSSALYLDISGLEPLYITVKNISGSEVPVA